jgi:L-lactate dehydrogenase complex protein LldG
MKQKTFHTFTRKLDQIEVDWSKTSSGEFVTVLSEVIVPPAVGSPLSLDAPGLPERLITPKPTPTDLKSARTGITRAHLGIATYGTIVLKQDNDWTEPVSLFPPLHVAVLRKSDIVPDMSSAFEWLAEAMTDHRASLVMATGPSATADMGALVRGAHGPESVHVIILSDL